MSSSTEFVVEQKELTDENIKQFRKFTSQSVGQSISVPENNVLFFGYRVSHQGAVKILVCVGTVRPVFDDAYLIFPPYKFPGEHFFPLQSTLLLIAS
ncbi:hypothetical protein EB796_010435 [Bugula neritina]|uniref:Uncharacterized protein n=1 Tax=Bugula neritina TaxID=10212 RepID=A0A7J7JXS6_BUGNE|nr:hypothetical protein EB796_010435 [Bugula neritina]